MRTDTRFLCNLSLISDCNGIALRRKNLSFERQQQHAHVLQKCTFFCGFVQRRRGAVASLSAFEVSRLRGEWDQRLRFNSCGCRFLCETYLLTFLMFEDLGIFEDAARLTVVPGKQYGQLLLHSFFLPHWKTSKCFRICC